MGTYAEITLEEFDALMLATPELGWIRETSGYEYVYTRKLATYPDIFIKVMSSIQVVGAKARNKGSDAIRVFAIQKINTPRNKYKGYIKQTRVNRTTNWKKNLGNAIMKVITQTYARKR